jgi:hypothetical protein
LEKIVIRKKIKGALLGKDWLMSKILSPFTYSDTNKRYYTYDYYLRTRFGRKVGKIPLDIGCTCPNIDGTKGTGGCIYCSRRGSGDFAGLPSQPIREQYDTLRQLLYKKWSGAACIPYFQAHTNTYGSVEELSPYFEQALLFPQSVGISIATRADCLTGWSDYLHDLNSRTFLTVELGLQSVWDRTASRINRCHSFAEFKEGYRLLEGIPVCIHLINGLPGETREDMVESAKIVGALHPFAVKIHLLHVLDHTVLGDLYRKGEVRPLEREEYVQIVCDQLEVLPPDTVIERLTGDGLAESLLAPEWSKKKLVVQNEIDKEMSRRMSMQGIKFCDFSD